MRLGLYRTDMVDKINPSDIEEEWKPVTIYNVIPNKYEVSNFGIIRHITSGKIVKPYTINTGYLAVTLLCEDGIYRHFLVHRVVANEYVPNPFNKNTVNHLLDKDKNYAYALEYSTQGENNDHVRKTGRNNNFGEGHYESKFTDSQVEYICYQLEKHVPYAQILTSIGFEDTKNNESLIGFIKRGITWKHISSKYKLE